MDDRKKSAWMFWIVTGLGVALFGVAAWVYLNIFNGSYNNTDAARSQLQKFLQACEVYRQKPQANGNFPAQLRDLVFPPERMTPVLDSGEAVLVDPWGKPYHYAVGETDAGPVAYVWFEREENGKMRGFGARLTAEGKFRRFTIADD